MAKWKTIRIRQEVIEEAKKEVEKGQYKGLSEFVSEAIRNRMQTLTKERVPEYLEQDRKSRILYPDQLQLFTRKHVFAQLTPKGTVKIGITDYFQAQLKEIVNVQLEKVGETITQDEPFGVAETWWFTYDLYAPMTGKIVAINNTIMDDPFALNVDPYQWLIEVEPTNTKDHPWMNGLLSFNQYNNHLTTLEGRLS